MDEKFILKYAYAADIFSKLNELNLYLQGSDIFAVHEKIRAFLKGFCCGRVVLRLGSMIVLKH